jgi:uncharacterized membrane protein YbhN (UPF0104 family)
MNTHADAPPRHVTAADANEPAQKAPPRYQQLKRWLGIAFALGMLGLVAWAARRVQWPEVLQALKAYDPALLGWAALVAAAGHLLYSLYDRLAMAWSGQDLATHRVMQVSLSSYAFNLNFGTLIGGLGSRVRMYSRLGLDGDAIGRVIAFSLTTNWAGYALLGGGVFVLGKVSPPSDWSIGQETLRLLGAAMWLLVAGYLLACGLSKKRSFSVRGHRIELPSFRTALLQLGLSSAHWMTVAAALYLLLQQQVAYPMVLAVFLVGAIAGAAAHIPAGLGVLETVFLAMLVPPLQQTAVLAALLAFRAVFYLIPLAVGLVLYLQLEWHARDQLKSRQDANAG